MKPDFASSSPGQRRPARRLAMRAGRVLVAAVALAAAMIASACGNSDPLAAKGDCTSDALIIGSANFPESETVANIYAEALRVNGFKVDTKFNIGSPRGLHPRTAPVRDLADPRLHRQPAAIPRQRRHGHRRRRGERRTHQALGDDLAIAHARPRRGQGRGGGHSRDGRQVEPEVHRRPRAALGRGEVRCARRIPGARGRTAGPGEATTAWIITAAQLRADRRRRRPGDGGARWSTAR